LFDAHGAALDQNIASSLASPTTSQARKELHAITLAISASLGGNCRECVISAWSGVCSLAAGQCCAGTSNQKKMGSGEVCSNLPHALLLLRFPRVAVWPPLPASCL